MNEQTIQIIAQAVIANTKVIQSLVDSLSSAEKQAVAGAAKVPQVTALAASCLSTNVPESPPAPAPVVVTMPSPPTFAPPPAVAPVEPPLVAAPFYDIRGLTQYVMTAYTELGAQKGARIQEVLISLGCQRIDEVTPEQYAQLYAGVEQLTAS